MDSVNRQRLIAAIEKLHEGLGEVIAIAREDVDAEKALRELVQAPEPTSPVPGLAQI